MLALLAVVNILNYFDNIAGYKKTASSRHLLPWWSATTSHGRGADLSTPSPAETDRRGRRQGQPDSVSCSAWEQPRDKDHLQTQRVNMA